MTKKIAIVGAGIAGLCAGVYARKSGFDVEIFEKERASGGLATSWKRQGYTFETCLHWLLGSNPRGPFHRLWKEVFDIDQLKFVDLEEFAHVEAESGERLIVHRNPERLEAELLNAAPEDRIPISRLVAGVKKLARMSMPVPGVGPLGYALQLIKALPYLPEMRFWMRITAEDFGSRFRNPLLRALFGEGGEARLSAAALVFSLGWMGNKDAQYPIGGSRAVIEPIERRFLDLGGKIHFEAKVDRILVENGAAAGIHLARGDEIRSDWVVSAADGHAALFEWIPPEYVDERVAAPYRNLETFPSYLQVSLGVKRGLSSEPPFFIRILQQPLDVDPKTRTERLTFRVFNFDPTFAPQGKTAVTCFIPTFNYAYWAELYRANPAEYAARKKEIADRVIEALERRIPGIKKDIEETDVSTPASVIRHTGNWQGSMEGFLLTPKSGFRALPNALARLRNFLMVGQWVMPGGGLPSGLMTGRDGIRRICRAEGVAFQRRMQRTS